jgi:multicomponent Na+:H+ antiporter subunit E
MLSGIYKPLIIGFGAFSAIIAVYVGRRMDAVDGQPVQIDLKPIAFIRYNIWLMVQIAKSNWAVTKLILSPTMKLRQHLFHVPFTQKSDLAQTIFANSITLTPGTISIEVEDGTFLVHAIDFDENDMEGLAEMDARVTASEKGS